METSATQAACVFRFGTFELDVRAGELRRSGVRVNLQEQPLKVLQCLLERPGELVTRDELRQRLWPDDTFVDFEQGVNGAVKRLRETLADSAETPRFVETLPRRGYRFIAPVERDIGHHPTRPFGAHPSSPTDQSRVGAIEIPRAGAPPWRRALLAAGAVAVLLGAVATWPLRYAPAIPAPDLRVVPLTNLTGSEYGATFSPDGRQVAFAWNGEQQDNVDIYVTIVGSSEMRRLTLGGAVDSAPQWSPDGKWIAYTRSESPDSHRIRVTSPLGGTDRQVSGFAVRPPAIWSPDGRFLVAGRALEVGAADRNNGLYLVPFDGGEPRSLTRVVGAGIDGWPAFSRDGRRLAYASCRGLIYRSDCHVQVLDLDPALVPTGPPRRLTKASFWTIQGLAWSRDGTSIVFGARQGAWTHLWRLAADGNHAPVRIEIAGLDAADPATTAVADRLAFSKMNENYDLYRLEVGGTARPVASSSARESLVQFSPDGQRMAFCSGRSGAAFEVWLANSDGSQPERLTRGPGRWQCSPTWSPNGKTIAFDSQAEDGTWHIWTIDVDGAAPQPITKEPGDQVRPTWSQDGQWIYFMWDQGRGPDIWRTRGPDGPREQVTFTGSISRAWESYDRSGVFYKRLSDSLNAPLYFQPLSGGEPRPLSACVSGQQFSVEQRGIYYVPCQPNEAGDVDLTLRILNPATGEDRLFATFKDIPYRALGRRVGGFVVSPDGQTILYGGLVSSAADLMLIEGFR